MVEASKIVINLLKKSHPVMQTLMRTAEQTSDALAINVLSLMTIVLIRIQIIVRDCTNK